MKNNYIIHFYKIISLLIIFNFYSRAMIFDSSKKDKSFKAIGCVDWTYDDMKQELKEFAQLYKTRPIKNNEGGMNSAHMFYVWFIARRMQPKYIIESGIFKGQSTWLFEVAAPKAKIISIDPALNYRVYISKNVRYESLDFTKIDWSDVDKKNTLCFFDDHQGVKRVLQCYNFGFEHVLYEDNYPCPGGNYVKTDLSPKATFLENDLNAIILNQILNIYYEFPPIYPNFSSQRFMWDKYCNVTPEPLLSKIDDEDFIVYANEAYGYTWLAYLNIKPNANLIISNAQKS